MAEPENLTLTNWRKKVNFSNINSFGLAICMLPFTGLHAEEMLSVPSDAKAKYTALEIDRIDTNILTIVTRREGPSGESFSKREINCEDMTFKYVGDGDTYQEAINGNMSGEMEMLVDGSISFYVAQYACAHAP